MSLRKTILLSVALTFLGLVVLLLVNLQTILSAHFAQEEQQTLELDVRRAEGVLEGEALRLQQAAFEWSRRQDLLGLNPAPSVQPADLALAEQDLLAAQVSVAVLLGPQGQVAFLTAGGAPRPNELVSWLQNQSPGLAATGSTGRQGWLRTSGGPLLVALQPTTSAGLVAVGRILDSDRIDALGERVSVTLALYAVDAGDLPADVRLAYAALEQGQPRFNYASGEDSTSGYRLLEDLAGHPAYILQVQQPRTAYFGGRLVINYLIIFLVVSSVVFAVIIILLLERLVLSRLSLLSREVNQIGEKGDFSRRVTLSQHDELTRLGKNINSMLAELSQRMNDLQALYEASQVLLGQLDTTVTLAAVCRLAVEKLGLDTAWIGQDWTGGSRLAPAAAFGCALESLPVLPMTGEIAGQPAACQALRQGQPVFQNNPAAFLGDENRATAAIPLGGGGGDLPVVLVLTSRTEDFFSPVRQRQALAFATQAELALQSARLYDQVLTARRQLESLSQRMLEVQEEERRRIARELHDEIGQVLTGLKLLLDASVTQPEKSAKARQMVNELIGRVRQMSLDLRPAMLDDLGLLPALIWQIDRYSSQTGIEVQFNQVGLQDRRFDSQVEITAYRLVQEALTNVARHAQVTEASVRVWVGESTLLVHVSDQGVGFDLGTVLHQMDGRGLLGMRERVKYVGGKLSIESQPGRGTQVMAELPVAELEKEGEDDHHFAGG
jgi:signal transduction histidine kinase